MAITDWPIAERPRERLLRCGADALTDAELLSLMLRNGDGRKDAVTHARELVTEYGSLRALLDAPTAELLATRGLGAAKVATLKGMLALAERYLLTPLSRGAVFSESADVRTYLRQRLGAREREVFGALFLDAQHRLIHYRELFFGTIDSASIHPREVLREALRFNAAAVIFVHNHPSGIAEPSGSDLVITSRLKHVLAEIDVRVLDHMIVAAESVVSMAERGLL